MTTELQPPVRTRDSRTTSSPAKPLRDQIIHSLRDAIVSGDLEPNERLVEVDIASQFQISRGPVREALRQLEQEGLVQSIPHRGTTVVDISLAEISEVLIPIRIVLETQAFLSARTRLRATDIKKLERCIADMRHGEHDVVADADVRFHRTVMQRASRPHTLQIWLSISARIRAYFMRYGQRRDATVEADQHQELLDALLAGDPDILRGLIRHHIAVIE